MKISRTELPNWLTSILNKSEELNEQKTTHVAMHNKVAMKKSDLDSLIAWNTAATSGIGNINDLRNILGEISNSFNTFSSVYKIGSKQNSKAIALKAQAILPDLENINAIKSVLQETLTILNLPQYSSQTTPIQILLHMIHMILSNHITEDKIAIIKRIAANEEIRRKTFEEESDSDKMGKTLCQATYSPGMKEWEKVIRIIREILQNACDATLKQRRIDPNHNPKIEINTWSYTSKGKPKIDLMVKDNGTGMDWDVLRENFFKYFSSGKDYEKEAAGGFGIAKALIQESPENGWSIETNKNHSSRFGRDMYFGRDPNDDFDRVESKIQKDKTGTTLTEYGLPYIDEWKIRDLCSYYALGQISIFVNGFSVSPAFSMNDIKTIGQNLTGLADAISDSPAEKKVAENIANDRLQKSEGDYNLGSLEWESNGHKTTVSFGIKKQTYSGKVYVLLNGQYQYTEPESYVPKADIICFIATDSRPREDEYPLDPGRENLRSPYKEEVHRAVELFKEILKKIAENQLFKAGLSINIFNKNLKPLEVGGLVDSEKQVEMDRVRDVFERAIGAKTVDPFFGSKNTTNPSSTSNESPTTPPVSTPAGEINTQEKSPEIVEIETEKKIEQVVKELNLDEQQTALVRASVKMMKTELDKGIDVKDDLDRLISGINTPCAVMIQKDFIANEAIEKNPDITANLILLWQSITSRIIKQASRLARGSKDKKYIPGVIFTNEAAALYCPPADNETYSSLSINPIFVASIIAPKEFETNQLLQEEASNPIKEEAQNIQMADQLSAFIMHLAIHEVTHLLFPNSYGTDYFHPNVTRVENACHFLYPEIKKDVKKYIKGLKKDTHNLMRIIKKDRASRSAPISTKAYFNLRQVKRF